MFAALCINTLMATILRTAENLIILANVQSANNNQQYNA